jgi:4-amino-4-deoxy-L-arabinose transferase-like glycosyltransferase
MLDPWLLTILAVALVLRIASIAATDDYTPVFDSGDYHRHAVSIAAGDGFPESAFTADPSPSAFRPPLYPYLLGGIYTVVGDDAGETGGRVAGALLGTLAVFLTFLIAARIWGHRVGLFSAAIAAVFPPLVLLNTALLSEPLFVCLMLGVVLAVLAARAEEGSWRWALAAGALCGLAALTRSNGILLVLPAALGVWTLRPRFSKRALAAPAAVAVAAILTVVPWTIRNTIEFDRVVPISTQSGFALAGAYNDEAAGEEGTPPGWVLPTLTDRYRAIFEEEGIDEAELDRTLRREAMDYALDDPPLVVETTLRNTLRTLGVDRYEPEEEADRQQLGLGARTATVVRWSFFALAVVALAGAVVLLRWARPRRGPAFLWWMPVLMILAAVWIIGSTRYRIPLYPFMAFLAAIACVDVLERVVSRREPTSGP